MLRFAPLCRSEKILFPSCPSDLDRRARHLCGRHHRGAGHLDGCGDGRDCLGACGITGSVWLAGGSDDTKCFPVRTAARVRRVGTPRRWRPFVPRTRWCRQSGVVIVSHVPGTGCAGDVRNDSSAYLRRSTYIIGESNSVADLTSSLDSGGFLWLIWLLL